MTGSFVYNPNTCHRVRFRHSISSGDGGALRLWLLTDSGTYQVACSTLQVLYSTMSNDLELKLFLLSSLAGVLELHAVTGGFFIALDSAASNCTLLALL